MKYLNKKFFASFLGYALLAPMLTLTPIVVTADKSFAAALESMQFTRNKVASIYKSDGKAPLDCYKSNGTCGGTRTSEFEEGLPAGGYFKITAYSSSLSPFELESCSSVGSCTKTRGSIYGFKPGEYFLFKKWALNSVFINPLLVFSLGTSDPFLVASGGLITWNFDSQAVNGSEGEYKNPPTSDVAVITGTAQVGSVLSGSQSYVGVDVSLGNRQWKRSDVYRLPSNALGTDIAGATGETYIPTQDDVGKYIRYTVQIKNMKGIAGFGGANTISAYLLISAPPALIPTFGSVTSTLGGYTVNLSNYDSTYTFSATSAAGTVSIGTASGLNLPLTVRGLTSTQTVQLTVTTTKANTPSGSANVSGTSLAAALNPTFGSVTSTLGGYTVNLSNYDSTYTFSATSSAGTVSIGTASGLNVPLTVRGLTSIQTAQVTVTTTKASNPSGSGNVSGTSLVAALTPTFGSVTSSLGGYTVNLSNYDSTYTFSATSSAGTVTIGAASGLNLPLTVRGLTSSQTVQVSVVTTKASTPSGSGNVSGTSLASAITSTTGPIGRWIASSIAATSGGMLIANQSGYLYTSTDNGINWAQRESIRNWSSVAQSDDGTMIFASVAGGKILKSANSGSTWSEVASTQDWRNIACDSDCSVIVAGAFNGALWVSTDSGTTWSIKSTANTWRSVATSSDGATILALAYGAQPFVSKNTGTTWDTNSKIWASADWVSAAVSADGATFYAAPFNGAISSSANAGSTWSEYMAPPSTTSISLAKNVQRLMQCGNDGAILMGYSVGVTVGRVVANPTSWSSCSMSANGTVLLATATTGLLYISRDGGDSWIAQSNQSGNINRRAIVATENGNQIYSAVYGGKLEYSNNSGSTWSTSYNSTQNWIGVAASASFQKVYAIAYQGLIYKSVDSGATWNQVESKRAWISIATSNDGSTVVALAMGGQIYVSNDSGQTFTARGAKRKWVSVALSSNGENIVAAVQNGFIYTSTDAGVTWVERASARNWSAVASSSNGNKLVATVALGKIYISSDSGASWSAKASNRNWLNVASSTSGNKLIAVVGSGQIYNSTDSGNNWTARESNRNWRALYLTGNGNRAFAADFGKKLYLSTDSGGSWSAS